METVFIKQLLKVAKESSLSFDEVFGIAYDYGIVDEFGNITPEIIKYYGL